MKNVHNGAVALLVVCSASREVVSVGIDRRVAVHREKPNGLGLVLAGGIEEAHKAIISACAISQEAQLIATAAGGEIRLWHKQVSFSMYRAPRSPDCDDVCVRGKDSAAMHDAEYHTAWDL